MKKNIAKKIISLRKAVGWTQSELARRSGITSAAISQIEKGNRWPSLEVIIKLRNALNVSILEFIEEPPYSQTQRELETFYRKYQDIRNALSKADENLILKIIERLKYLS